jgi:hypothetical protein
MKHSLTKSQKKLKINMENNKRPYPISKLVLVTGLGRAVLSGKPRLLDLSVGKESKLITAHLVQGTKLQATSPS